MIRILDERRPSVYRMTLAVIGALLLIPVVSDAEQSEGIALLEKMSIAADQLDYKGDFVVVKGGEITTMRIIHSFTEKGSRQKLMSLNGSTREIIQQDDFIACVLPDQGMGMKEKRQVTRPFTLSISEDIEQIERHYIVEQKGSARIANRDCAKLEITPKDTLRYGYKLCIDNDKALLLSAELVTTDGVSLESYMFVDVQFDDIDETEFVSSTNPGTLDWMDDQQADVSSDNTKNWQVSSNKSGFELRQYIRRISPVLQKGITHMVLGDGLAKVSVFVTPGDDSGSKAQTLKMGSLNSYSRQHEGFLITVIGEVPPETVTLIAEHTQTHEFTGFSGQKALHT